MKKYIKYPVILMLGYLSFSFIDNTFNPTLWEKDDKLACLIIIAVTWTSQMYVDDLKKDN